MEKDLICCMCRDLFDDDDNPRQLSCGHSICHECVEKLLANGPMCSECNNIWACRDCQMSNVRGPAATSAPSSAIENVKKVQIDRISSYLGNINMFIKEFQEKMYHIESRKMTHKEFLSQLVSKEKNLISSFDDRMKDLDNAQATVCTYRDEMEAMTCGIVECKSPEDVLQTVKNVSKSFGNISKHVLLLEKQLEAQASISELETLSLKGVLETGMQIFAFLQIDKKTTKWARISIHGDCAHIHALQDEHPPVTSLMIPYQSAIALFPKYSPSCYMELHWAGMHQGFVYIKMFGHTRLGEQFTYLCSGEKGQCYKNTNFYKAENLDTPNEVISGGDYEHNDGTGGKSIINGIKTGGAYERVIVAGLIVSWPEQWRNGSFEIFLSDNIKFSDLSGFAQVVSGLGVLKAAARHSPISEVKIEDCGLVIPL